MEPGASLTVVFVLAASTLLCATGITLLLVRPSTLPARLWAMYLLVLGVRELAALQYAHPDWPEGVNYHTWGWHALFESLTIWSNLALAAFLYSFPRDPPRRSWHTVVFAIAFAAYGLGALLYVFAPGTLYQGWERAVVPDPLLTTPLYSWTIRNGTGLWLVPMLVSALVRARAEPDPVPRASAGFLAFTLAGGFATLLLYPGVALRAIVYDGAAIGATLAAATLRIVGWGAPFTMLRALVIHVGLLWFAVSTWRRERSRAALALTGAGFALFFLPPGELGGYSFPLALACIGTLYLLHRYPSVLGSTPPSMAPLLPIAVFATVFLLVTSLVLGMLPASSSLAAVLAALAGGIVAGLLVRLVLPGGRLGAALGAGSGPGPAIDAYRAALVTELEDGKSPEEITARLRALRAELGITDSEHAVMEYTLRGARGSGTREARELKPGDRFLSRYRVRALLGRGGEGETFLATDERVRRDVVIKRLRFPTTRIEDVETVLKEARAFAACRHANVITLYDVEQVGNEAFLVMEYADAGALAQRLRDSPLPRDAWVALARDVLRALAAVHAAGLVHRDVKPSNILLMRTGEAKLADFGVSRVRGFDTTVSRLNVGVDPVGTVSYMSPEVARGQSASTASDLYSAAATLYEALVGSPLVRRSPNESVVELQMRVASAGAAPVALAGDALRPWFERALAKDPRKRFASAAEMERALLAALSARAEHEERAPQRDDVA